MAKLTQCKRQPKSLSQPGNHRGYTNQPAQGYTMRECQLTLTESLAPRDKDKFPFDGTIEEELALYRILFPTNFSVFFKFKQRPLLFGQNICPDQYQNLIQRLYEGELTPKDCYVAIGDLVLTLFCSCNLRPETNLLGRYLFTKATSYELTTIYQAKREQGIEDQNKG